MSISLSSLISKEKRVNRGGPPSRAYLFPHTKTYNCMLTASAYVSCACDIYICTQFIAFTSANEQCHNSRRATASGMDDSAGSSGSSDRRNSTGTNTAKTRKAVLSVIIKQLLPGLHPVFIIEDFGIFRSAWGKSGSGIRQESRRRVTKSSSVPFLTCAPR